VPLFPEHAILRLPEKSQVFPLIFLSYAQMTLMYMNLLHISAKNRVIHIICVLFWLHSDQNISLQSATVSFMITILEQMTVNDWGKGVVKQLAIFIKTQDPDW